jgi:hypothetical protein
MQHATNTGIGQNQHRLAEGAGAAACTSSDNAAVAGSPSKITLFDELVSCMGRIVLPPADDCRMSAPIASHVAILRENFATAHDTVLACIQNMQIAWSVLATVSSGADLPPAASSSDALNARIRDLELQLADANLAVSNSACDLRSFDAKSRDIALFQKLSDAAASSLKRKDKGFMVEVYNRHAKPIGFKARALVAALREIDPSAFSAQDQVSDDDAAKTLKVLDTSNKGHCNYEEFCKACNSSCDLLDAGADTSPTRVAFLRFADVKGLTAMALMDALKEVDAPVLSVSEGRSPESIFRRADVNLSGSVDLAELDLPPPPLPLSSVL